MDTPAYSPSLYKDRAEWSDVKPVYNSEKEDGVVKIAATEDFIDAYAYLRAVFSAGEISERVFDLTTTCIQLNPANYTVWQYRRKLIKTLGKSVDEELQFCESIAADHPKNYQIWHHRRTLVGGTRDYAAELEFTANFLQDDSKNYHAWQYRQWVVDEFNLLSEDELDYAMGHLLSDLRNNSAWNYRYFVLARLSDGFKSGVMIDKEIAFVLQCIKRVSNNESAWSYLSGYSAFSILSMRDGLASSESVNQFCAELLAQRDPVCKSPHLRNFLVDGIVEWLERGHKTGEETARKVAEAYQLLAELESLDPVRRKFYRYRRLQVDNLVNG